MGQIKEKQRINSHHSLSHKRGSEQRERASEWDVRKNAWTDNWVAQYFSLYSLLIWPTVHYILYARTWDRSQTHLSALTCPNQFIVDCCPSVALLSPSWAVPHRHNLISDRLEYLLGIVSRPPSTKPPIPSATMPSYYLYTNARCNNTPSLAISNINPLWLDFPCMIKTNSVIDLRNTVEILFWPRRILFWPLGCFSDSDVGTEEFSSRPKYSIPSGNDEVYSIFCRTSWS